MKTKDPKKLKTPDPSAPSDVSPTVDSPTGVSDIAGKSPEVIPAASPEIPAVEGTPISVEALVSPLVETMPEPTAVPDSSNPAPANSIPAPTTEARRILDNRGTAFDPARHAVDDKGNPRLNKRGNFISNSVGRPAGKSTASDAEQPDAKTPIKDLVNNGAPDLFDQTAEMYLGIGYGIAASFLSDEIRPENKEEHDSMRIPLSMALREKGDIPLSAMQMFWLAFAAYVAKKTAKPTVRERFGIMVHRIKSFFVRPKIEIEKS